MDAALRAVAAGLIACSLGGCAAPAPIFLAMTSVDLASTGMTGKSLEEHGLDLATGEDCNMMAAVFENDGVLCEPDGSAAARGEFGGLMDMADRTAYEPVTKYDLIRAERSDR